MNPVDLPPFFAERPSGMPTSASTRQAAGRAKRRCSSMSNQRAVGSSACAKRHNARVGIPDTCDHCCAAGIGPTGGVSGSGTGMEMSLSSKVDI